MISDYAWSIVSTPFGIGGGLLLLGALAAFVYLPKLAPVLLVAAAASGALGYVDRLQTDLAAAESRATEAESKAEDNAAAAVELAGQLRRQAEVYRTNALQARTDADRAEVARQAAAAAAKACGAKGGRALKVTPEDAPLPASLRGGLIGMRGWAR